MDVLALIIYEFVITSLIISAVVLYAKQHRGRASDEPVPLTVGLASIREKMASKLSTLFSQNAIGDEFWTDLESSLIEADVGIDVTTKLLDSVRSERTTEGVKKQISESMIRIFEDSLSPLGERGSVVPHVILVVGVNGVGKTTTIAKLAYHYIREGKRVLLVAADTFRAAAVEQLKVWGERLACDVVAQRIGADSAAVAFDGVEKGKAKNYDLVIIDTAGRLHTKKNLMEELKKVSRVIGKAVHEAPHEKLLVLDATIGSNGLSQARQFDEALGLTGAVITKLDGTAKGGIVFAVAGELGIPITHIGIGEGMEDLRPFDPSEFVKTILPS